MIVTEEVITTNINIKRYDAGPTVEETQVTLPLTGGETRALLDFLGLYGTRKKVYAIKLLRTMFPELDLRQAKELVEASITS